MNVKVQNAKKPIKINHSVVLITGDGSTLRVDLDKFLALKIPHDVYAIGRSYQAYPPKMKIDHWGNVDGDACIWWAEHLPADKIHEGTLRHTLGDVWGYDVDWDVDGSPYDMSEVLWHGSTSLFAVLTCLVMGYEQLFLAGCPLDRNGHWYFPGTTGPEWGEGTYQAWRDFASSPEAKKVKSFSGYTAQLLGVPSETYS